jgi:betaine-aldehyde dehydrogenase
MTDRVLQNFVNGKFTDASDGRTSDVVDPSTGEVYAQAPISSRQDVDAAMLPRRTRSRAGGTAPRPSAA